MTGARGGPEKHAHVEYSGGNAGGKGYLLPFLHRSPETEDVLKGPRDDVRADNGLANDVRVSPTDEGAGTAPLKEV